jgi:hypothetical protein
MTLAETVERNAGPEVDVAVAASVVEELAGRVAEDRQCRLLVRGALGGVKSTVRPVCPDEIGERCEHCGE